MKRERLTERARSCACGIVLLLLIAAISGMFCGCSRVKPALSEKSDCLHAGYDRYTYYNPTTVPDNNRAGITIGPVRVDADGGCLENVILRLAVSHPSTADLVVRLRYDANGDRETEALVPVEFFRGRGDGCVAPEPYSCTIALQGIYWFRNDGLGGLDRSFDVFAGLPSGGSFYLDVADTIAKDMGSVANWSVYVKKTYLMAAR